MSSPLAPLPEPWPPEIAALLANYPQQDGYLLTLFRSFANSARFLRKGVPNLLDRDSPLPLRIRELVILRTAANCRCEYEWGVHVAIFAAAARLTPAEIAATATPGLDPAQWSPAEAGLLAAVDDLCRGGGLGDETLPAFDRDWTAEQQLEILALCGTYHTISFVANTARLPNEAFGARFSPDRPTP